MIRSQCRRVLLALIAPAFLFGSLNAWSLGMGEIDVDSALNERFDASIVLSDARDLQDSEIVVSLASRNDFERVGVERFHFLTTLNFEVDTSGADPVVKISSNQPISEPYLNFIVEVLWPNGRLLREYTVLLDPPTFSAAAAPQVSTPVEAPAERRAPAQTRQERPSQVAIAPRPTRAPAPARTAQEGDLMTTTDDTLWKIANRTRSDRVDVNQQMLAIQELNPRAFIRNNINLLKAGYRLTLPTEEQALNLSTQDAQLAVSDQANSWRNPVAETASASQSSQESENLQSQVDATDDTPQEVVEVESEQGQVRIVAAGGDLAQGTSAEEDAQSGVLLEENETLTRQVDELQYQLDREKELAANQIELKERELEVKDQELAALQARLTELEKQSAERRQNQDTPAQQAEVPIWQSPMVLGGVIGLLILVLVFVLLRNRRSADEDDFEEEYEDTYVSEYEQEAEQEAATEPKVSAVEENDEIEAEDDVLAFDDEDTTSESLDEALEETVAGDAETSDVIGEADIYVAYGRHGQALTLLKGALEKEPERHDVRLKLLEVCVDAEDPNQFAENAEYLVANCEDEDILMACRELEGRMNSEVASLDDLASTEEVASEVESAQEEEVSDDDILSLDELEDTAPATDDVVADEPETTESSADDEFELEFDLDDSPETEDALDIDVPETETDSDESLSLGGDLGIDFDPDADADSGGSENAGSDDGEFDLSELDALEASEDADNNSSEAVDEAAEEEIADFEFETEGDADINATKIDLAEAYIDMGDGDGARDILSEVLEEGTDEQKARAQELLSSLD